MSFFCAFWESSYCSCHYCRRSNSRVAIAMVEFLGIKRSPVPLPSPAPSYAKIQSSYDQPDLLWMTPFSGCPDYPFPLSKVLSHGLLSKYACSSLVAMCHAYLEGVVVDWRHSRVGDNLHLIKRQQLTTTGKCDS